VVTGPGANFVDVWESDNSLVPGATLTWTGYLGNALTQATAANQPTVNVVDPTLPGGHPSLQGSGSSQYLRNLAIVQPAPGTTPPDVVALMVADAWAANRALWALGATALSVIQSSATPAIAETNGSAVNTTSLTIAAWSRIIAHFTDSTSDYLQVRSTK